MSRSRLIWMIRRCATVTESEKTEDLAEGVFLFYLLPSSVLTLHKGCQQRRATPVATYQDKKFLFNLIQLHYGIPDQIISFRCAHEFLKATDIKSEQLK